MNVAPSSEEKRFGKFVLLHQLTGGGIGAPCIAFDTDASEIIVLKRLKKKDRAGGAGFDRFRDEIQITQELGSHHNLVRQRETSTIDGEPYLALEWIKGQDLRQLDEQSRKYDPITLRLMGRIVQSVCDALAYATEQVKTFVHRDIAPGNIIVGYDGVTKLIDYGLALFPLKTAKTNDGDVPGTPGFVAPERQQFKKGDVRSDLYSLASVALFLMTGAPPSGKGTEDLALPYVAEGRAKPIVPFLTRALAANPDDRYQTIAEFSAALQEAIGELATEDELGTFVSDLFAGHKANLIEREKLWRKQWGKPNARPQKTQQLNLSPDGKPIAGPRTITLPGSGPAANLEPPPEPESSRRPTVPIKTKPVKEAAQTTLVIDAVPSYGRRAAMIAAVVGAVAVLVMVAIWFVTKKPASNDEATTQPPQHEQKQHAAPLAVPEPAPALSAPALVVAPAAPPHVAPAPSTPKPSAPEAEAVKVVERPAPKQIVVPVRSRTCALLSQAEDALSDGKYDQVVRFASECINRNAALPDALLFRAKAEALQGRMTAARNDAQKALSLGNSKARQLIDTLGR
jgi:serine/threonine-protein kinase